MNHLLRSCAYLFAIALLSTGCKQNPCKDKDCGAYGVCENGTCICEPGFTTDADGACNTRIAGLMKGTYDAKVSGCKTGNYKVTLLPSNVFDNILVIVNLGGYKCSNGDDVVVEAVIESPTTFKLEEARYCEQYNISGSGTISDREITIQYSVAYGGSEATGELVEETCSVKLKRS
ncbi:MAG: hypothetical protein NWR72_20650 [Bacteroidia bacterium]|nr:hypothetical protein [Bacteroidia bacterium]